MDFLTWYIVDKYVLGFEDPYGIELMSGFIKKYGPWFHYVFLSVLYFVGTHGLELYLIKEYCKEERALRKQRQKLDINVCKQGEKKNLSTEVICNQKDNNKVNETDRVKGVTSKLK